MATTTLLEQEQNTPPDLKSALHEISSNLEKSKGTTLFRLGDEAAGVFLVRKGRVRLTLDGTPAATRTLGSGSILGLPATLNLRPYSMTATALEDCQLDFVDQKALLNLFRSNTVVCFQALQVLGSEISDMRKSMSRRQERRTAR